MRAVRGLSALTSNRYNKPVGAEKLAVSSPSTCQGYCEVRRAAEGAGSTPSRNAEFKSATCARGQVLRVATHAAAR
jgi:hypothetical protein